MSDRLFSLFAFLKFIVKSKTKYYMHSPFVYDLMAHVLEKKNTESELVFIQSIRQQLRREKDIKLTFQPIGAIANSSIKSMATIEKNLSIPHRIGARLFHCIQRYNYQTIVEIGTCIGIGALYLAKAEQEATVYTLEGNPDCYQKAAQLFAQNDIKNIEIIPGLFEESLPLLLQKINKIDLVVIDGNHQYESTVRYFNQLLPYLHEDSLVVIDDIYWSKEMNRAWKEICQHNRVTLSLDFYRNGFLFFKKNRLEKEHFLIHLFDW
jgi:predicted O-methyltransferase YrrM